MGKQVYWLSDAEWRRIEPLLPRGRKGAHRVDDRRVISGIMHMLKSGSRWRDCPEALKDVYKLLEEGFDLLHFVCHGVADSDNISNAALELSARTQDGRGWETNELKSLVV